MIFVIFFIVLFAFSCGESGTGREYAGEDYSPGEGSPAETDCSEKEIFYSKPALPDEPEVNVPVAYNENQKCMPLPEAENGKIVLGSGCFSGCIKVEKRLAIVGKGAENTAIFCDDEEKGAVIEVAGNAELSLENLSLRGKTRCLTGADNSMTSVKNSNLSHCTKGGINICQDGAGCRAVLSVENSFIGDIDEAASGISYGISFGNGTLNISGSEISGMNSFGVAVWGETGEKNEINIENSIISSVYGGIRSYEGHGLYAENSANITIRNSSVSDTATSFVFLSADEGEIKLQLIDFIAENMLETNEEQGGVVLDGKVYAFFERVRIEKSRGNGIFLRGSSLNGKDLTIKSITSDGLGNNGFGMQLLEGSESSIKNLSVVSAEKAGLLLDGNCRADIDGFEIVSTKSDSLSGEFGVGAGVQDGAELSARNGVFSANRESGVLVIGADVSLKNVEIKGTKPRECSKAKKCVFAPDTDFGHGISLYSLSILRFDALALSGNNNGLNVENSEIFSSGAGDIFFNRNTTAVNAWNINDWDKLERNLSNSSFCENETVFTADLQPVREGL